MHRFFRTGSLGVDASESSAGTGADHVAAAFATVHTPSPGASFLAYASVVDNRTGDPTLILPQ